ncbi:MAG: TonB-dependent receptor, partial [Acidobacteria bacterium]|nr:TonB-dependent receptor [Acidobacteriota bacterium]
MKTSTLSNDAGLYRVLGLQPGPYQIQASLAGFKTFVREVVLEVGRVTTVNVAMEVGDVTERVVVEARAPVLETDSQAVSTLMEQQYLKNMPLLLRRPAQLLTMAAGVTFTSTDARSYFNPFYSVAGGRQNTQQYFIDGGNASNTRVEISILDINPSIETVQEFRLVENNYKAEFGGGGGGLMLITTKSGTNEFHGSFWEFHRQKALDARNYFASTKTPFREHVFGGAVGGPIVRDKLHFFGSWEATHNVVSFPEFQTIPTQAWRRGDFSRLFNRDGSLRQIYDPQSTQVGPGGTVTRTPFAGNIIPQTRISPIASRMVAFYPEPNRPPADPTGTLNVFGTRNEHLDRNAFTGRVDWNKSERNMIFHRFLLDFPYFENNGPWPGLSGFTRRATGIKKALDDRHPADPGDFVSPTMSKNFLTGWTHAQATWVNELRFTYSTRRWGAHDAGSGLGFPKEFGLTVPQVSSGTSYANEPNDHFPRMNIERYQSLGGTWGGGTYQLPMRNFHAAETVSHLMSSHSFKAGYETRRSSSTYYFKNQSSGAYTFNSRGTASGPQDAASGDGLASLLLDFPFQGSLNDINNRTFRTWWHALFVQDDWRVTRHFTLNLGLRWEVDTPMAENNNLIAGFDPSARNPVCNCPGTVTFPTSFNEYNWHNWQPRVGLVWNPKGGRTVFRAGAGRFFNPPYGASIWGIPGTARPDVSRTLSVISPDNGLTAPYRLATGLPSPPPFDPSQLTAGFGAVAPGQPPRLSPDFIERTRGQAYSMMVNADIQHQVGGGVVLEVGWIANLGHHLDRGTLALNQVPPSLMRAGSVQALRPFPQFDNVNQFTSTIGNSSYHALLIKAEKRFGAGLGFSTNYTFSKFIDDFSISNAYNRRADKGPSTLQRAHRVVLSGVYELPAGRGRQHLSQGPTAHILGGWNLGVLFTAESGAPLNFSSSPNLCNCFNNAAVRPNLVGDPKGPKS